MRATSGSPTSPSRLVRGFRKLRGVRRLPVWVRYLITAGLVFACVVVRSALEGPLQGYPFLLFFPAIILSGALFSRGAGVLAAVLSIPLAMWFMPPAGELGVEREGIVPLLLYILIGLTCALTLEALQEAVAETIEREERLNQVIGALEASERQTQTLLVELSHRIRNDLGSLAGVLNLQSKEAPEAAGPLKAAANRVRVLGRVHSRLAHSGSHVVVDAKEFLTELGRDLEAAQLAEASVHLTVDAVRAPLPLESATALGLIVNELVTNAAKYAFPDGIGTVAVSFLRRDDHFVLTVSDDGVGSDETVRGSGIGTKIIRSLAAQLGGTFERRRGARGTIATVTVPVPDLTEAPPPAGSQAERRAQGEAPLTVAVESA